MVHCYFCCDESLLLCVTDTGAELVLPCRVRSASTYLIVRAHLGELYLKGEGLIDVVTFCLCFQLVILFTLSLSDNIV